MEDSIDAQLMVAALTGSCDLYLPGQIINRDTVLTRIAAIHDAASANAIVAAGGIDALISLAMEGLPIVGAIAALGTLSAHGAVPTFDSIVDKLVRLSMQSDDSDTLAIAMTVLASFIAVSDRPIFGGTEGAQRLKSYTTTYPEFWTLVISRLDRSEAQVSVSAFQIINSVIRDIMGDADDKLPNLSLVLQLLRAGVAHSAWKLMHSSDLSDQLQTEVVGFQFLMRELYRRYRARPVKQEHLSVLRDHGLKVVKLLHAPETLESTWSKLGFKNTETPVADFFSVGDLGLLDLEFYIKFCGENEFVTLLHEQWEQSQVQCPVVNASITVTTLLYEFLNVANENSPFDPLILQWDALHIAGLDLFLRTWKDSRAASTADSFRVRDLVSVFFRQIRERTKQGDLLLDPADMALQITYTDLRKLQLEYISRDRLHETGLKEIEKLRIQLAEEALEFVMEQRVSCLLQGAWFLNNSPDSIPRTGTTSLLSAIPRESPSILSGGSIETGSTNTWGAWQGQNFWKYVRLSHSRRQLHYGDYDQRLSSSKTPSIDDLPGVIDLSSISAVMLSNNVELKATTLEDIISDDQSGPNDTIQGGTTTLLTPGTISNSKFAFKLTLQGYKAGADPALTHETVLLNLYAQTAVSAAEWYDGLNVLLSRNGFSGISRILKTPMVQPQSPSSLSGRHSFEPLKRTTELLRTPMTITTESIECIKMITDTTTSVRLLDLNGLKTATRAIHASVEYPAQNFYYNDPF
ncbi:ELMO/CED-12 family-domain-containing protein [Lipomyces arxii]|uniref:ELMO/CED-12 family-domain-containing protein n=1 Tax=Lipomyces arxii TaxID=56418 RepID=UPI0034CF18E9